MQSAGRSQQGSAAAKDVKRVSKQRSACVPGLQSAKNAAKVGKNAAKGQDRDLAAREKALAKREAEVEARERALEALGGNLKVGRGSACS